MIAQSMRTGSTGTIGLAMSAISNPYFADVVHAVEEQAARAGLTLLLIDTHDDPAREFTAVQQLEGRRVDAVILAPSAKPEAALAYLRRRGTPTVLIDRLLDVELDQVAAQNTAPTAQLVEHLAVNGHRRIGMISGLDGLATSEERLAGYREGLRRCGLEFDPDLVVSGGSQEHLAREAVGRLLSGPTRPTALLVANNQMTIGVMRGLQDLSMVVPRDIALVVFDDFPWADLFHPRLTSIAQPIQAMGELAVDLLTARLRTPDAPPRKLRLETTFVHRDSCGCHLGTGVSALSGS
jgi:LacI family transcriptional regulator